MHSVILISRDEKQMQDYIQNFCKEKGIGKFDQTIFAPSETSFGIADVRSIQKAAYLKPSSGKEKLLIVQDAQLLTPEAQNALLKILEEPPQHTFIFLTCTTDAFFLPTILSRCKTIRLEEKANTVSEEDALQYTGILESLLSSSIPHKLALAERLSGEKEKLSAWLTTYILFLRQKMLQDTDNHAYPMLLTNLQEAHRLIQTTNVAPRVILEHMFLGNHKK